MSPFKQEVTDALREASREWARAAYMEDDFPRWLAPRVAAAIIASNLAGGTLYWQEAALAALRGVATGEEPQ